MTRLKIASLLALVLALAFASLPIIAPAMTALGALFAAQWLIVSAVTFMLSRQEE